LSFGIVGFRLCTGLLLHQDSGTLRQSAFVFDTLACAEETWFEVLTSVTGTLIRQRLLRLASASRQRRARLRLRSRQGQSVPAEFLSTYWLSSNVELDDVSADARAHGIDVAINLASSVDS